MARASAAGIQSTLEQLQGLKPFIEVAVYRHFFGLLAVANQVVQHMVLVMLHARWEQLWLGHQGPVAVTRCCVTQSPPLNAAAVVGPEQTPLAEPEIQFTGPQASPTNALNMQHCIVVAGRSERERGLLIKTSKARALLQNRTAAQGTQPSLGEIDEMRAIAQQTLAVHQTTVQQLAEMSGLELGLKLQNHG